MSSVAQKRFILDPDDVILVTGAAGFIGISVVQGLLNLGFRRIRCFVRSAKRIAQLRALDNGGSRVEILEGNLLAMDDCVAATREAMVVIHLAAGRGEKSFPDAFMNSVVTTRNLLDGCLHHRKILRFVNVSTFAVYTNTDKGLGNLLDEGCTVEEHPEIRGEAYCFAKTKQEELVTAYGKQHGISYVHIRPGAVYGPGNTGITGRVGVGTFGVFLHLGGGNQIPFTYVDNCADAIALAGITAGIENEIFNVVDDNLPSSREFLRLYKRHVKPFRSLYLPKAVSYGLCYLWEQYSAWSEGQLPPAFNRSRWNSFWRKTRYTNAKLKTRLGWEPSVSTEEGLRRYFEACRAKEIHA